MIRQFITLAFRNVLKNRATTIMNVVSFAIGLTASIIALLFVNYSLSFDDFHEDSDRIYRVIKRVERDNNTNIFFGTNGNEAPEIKAGYPQVELITRVMPDGVYANIAGDQENGFNELIYVVDPDFLRMFHCPLKQGGNVETVFKNPYTVLISQETATKMFGDKNPVGNLIQFNGYYVKKEYTVSGVFEDFPDNSIFNPSFITAEHDEMPDWLWRDWNAESSYLPVGTYVKLVKGADYKQFEKGLEALVQTNYPEELKSKAKYLLQKFDRIFLYSQQDFGQQNYSNIYYVYIFIALGLFILIISSVNFINLTTGRLLLRAKEIGVKKAFGTSRFHIYMQFISESFFLILITLPVSVFLVYLLLPVVQQTLNISLEFSWMLKFSFILKVLFMIFFISTVTGFLSAMSFAWVTPTSVLNRRLKMGSKKQLSQKVMFIVQYALSVILISTTVIMYQQLNYLMNKDLGFDKENKIIIPIFSSDPKLRGNFEQVKDEFLKNPDILSASASHFLIGSGGERHKVFPEGKTGESWDMAVLAVDEDFIQTYGVKLLEGRSFSRDISSDRTDAFILNETAVKKLNWDDPVGKRFGWAYGNGTVIGVVKDFNVADLSHEIEPLVLCMWVPTWNWLTVRYKTDNYPKLINYLEEKTKMFAPELPFNYRRFDEAIDRNNLTIFQIFRNTSIFFSLIAILIACIGLFGLASFSASQRIKEIGIRKTIGSTVWQIVTLLMKGFLKWVVLACVIGLPIGWYLSGILVRPYPYRIRIQIWAFLLAGIIALFIAALTVIMQSVKSAGRNPTEALRYE